MIRWLAASLLIAFTLLAQVPMTFQYFYDESGQLTKVVDSTGIVVEYVYDAVGNMLEIKRSTIASGSLQIFSFSPASGGPLTRIAIRGQGFSLTPSQNLVRFNGVLAMVVSATAAVLIVEVPTSVGSGQITISVGASSANSSQSFQILALPIITGISPNKSAPGVTVPSFTVNGLNLNGASFEFAPAFAPQFVVVNSSNVNNLGTSATLSLAISNKATGDFVLIARTAVGSSDGFPTAANTLRIALPTYQSSQVISILNTLVQPQPLTTRAVGSNLYSFLNKALLASAPTQRQAMSVVLSILNGTQIQPVSSLQSIVSDVEQRGRGVSRFSTIGGYVVGAGVAGMGPDTDGDGIPDELERLISTDPRIADSDGDGFPDGLEIARGSDPLRADSVPNLQPPSIIQSAKFSIRNTAASSRSGNIGVHK